MSRPVLIAMVLAMVASATTIFLFRENAPVAPQMSDEQRVTRNKFFGAREELPPIKKGQEMHPQW